MGAIPSAITLFGVGLFFRHWWIEGRFIEETDDAYVRADIVTISPRVAGYVASLPVADHAPVEAGAVLLRIDDRDFRAKQDQARSAVKKAAADIAAEEAASANPDAQIAQLSSSIAAAEARRAGAETRRTRLDHQRYRALAAGRAATAYLVAEIIVIPMTDWLVELFSIRRVLLVGAAAFLLFSLSCSFVTGIEAMIAARALQGAFGGARLSSQRRRNNWEAQPTGT